MTPPNPYEPFSTLSIFSAPKLEPMSTEMHIAKSYTDRSTLEEARELVEGGERNQAYGPPEMDFKRIAGMISALFEHKLKEGVVFDPADVARIQICLKLSRSTWQKKRDNWVDIEGYGACGHRCDFGQW